MQDSRRRYRLLKEELCRETNEMFFEDFHENRDFFYSAPDHVSLFQEKRIFFVKVWTL